MKTDLQIVNVGLKPAPLQMSHAQRNSTALPCDRAAGKGSLLFEALQPKCHQYSETATGKQASLKARNSRCSAWSWAASHDRSCGRWPCPSPHQQIQMLMQVQADAMLILPREGCRESPVRPAVPLHGVASLIRDNAGQEAE